MLEDRVELPRVYMAWHSPAMFADGDAEMDLLADLLANGKTSRLYRTLVYERRIALDVSAFQSSRELGSFFLLAATAAPGPVAHRHRGGRSTRSCSGSSTGGPTDAEMERAAAQAEAHFMYRLQTVGGFGGKSDQLNAYNVFRGDPGFFAADLDALSRTRRSESVRAAAARCLRVRSPRAAQRRAARPAGARAAGLRAGVGVVMRVDRSRLPDVGPDPAFRFPAIVRHTLANGLQVRTVEHHSVPVVTFVLQVEGGSGADPAGQEGLAAITADMVDEGTGVAERASTSRTRWRGSAREYDVDVGPDATMFTLTTLTRFARARRDRCSPT